MKVCNGCRVCTASIQRLVGTSKFDLMFVKQCPRVAGKPATTEAEAASHFEAVRGEMEKAFSEVGITPSTDGFVQVTIMVDGRPCRVRLGGFKNETEVKG